MTTLSATHQHRSTFADFLSSPRLRTFAMTLVGASMLVGCDDGFPRFSEKISAEDFRTNFSAYAGKNVAFEAYYTKEMIGTKKGEWDSNNIYTIYRYEFYSDPEKSLKVATCTSTHPLTRDKAIVVIPVAKSVADTITIEWGKLKFKGIDDVTRPVNPEAAGQHLEKAGKADSPQPKPPGRIP